MKNSAFLFLILLIILSGCITSSTPYQNDVIVQENYVLTRANPFTDSTTTIRFNLRNLGRDVVPRTIVDFLIYKGWELTVCNAKMDIKSAIIVANSRISIVLIQD